MGAPLWRSTFAKRATVDNLRRLACQP